MSFSVRPGRRARRTLRLVLPAAGVLAVVSAAWWLGRDAPSSIRPHTGHHRLEHVATIAQGDGGPTALAGVRAVALDPSGHSGWAVATDSGQLVSLDLNGAPRVQAQVPAPGVRDLALLPESKLLIGATPDELMVWSVATSRPTPLGALPGGAAGLVVGLDDQGELLASIHDGAVRLWRPTAQGLQPGPELQHPDLAGARGAVFGEQGRLYVAAFARDAIAVIETGPERLMLQRSVSDPALDGVDALVFTDDGTLVAASFCGHRLSTWAPGEGGALRKRGTTNPVAVGGCAPVIEAAHEEGVLHPTALAALDGGRVAVTGLSALLDLRTYRLDASGDLISDGGLDTQPDWMDYSRFPWAGPESEGDGPPLPPGPKEWRDRADLASNGVDLLAAGFIPDAIAWVPGAGEPTFLHKGTGGAGDLAGAYNLEIAADGAAVYAAPRAEPELVLAGMALGEDGSLRPLPVEALQPEQIGAGAMLNVTISPDGEHVYAVDADFGGLHTYARSEAGALERASRRQIPDCAGRPPMAVDVVTSHDGQQLYVADFQWDGPSCVHVFGVDAEGIAQEVAQTLAADDLRGVEALAPTPDGSEVLAACHISESVTRLLRDPQTGALRLGPVARRADLNGAEFVVIAPDGESVYASSPVSNTVVAFRRDLGSGALTWTQTLTGGADLPLIDAAGLAISADGQHVLVAARISNAVSLFARGADGRLTLEDAAQQGKDGITGLTWVNGVDVHKGRVVTAAVADGAVSTFRIVPEGG